MNEKKPVFHMLFEQSNTFRDVARELGYDAESYGIQRSLISKEFAVTFILGFVLGEDL